MNKFCNFQDLRKKENLDSNDTVKYFLIVFDILHLNGFDLHYLPLEQRKAILYQNFFNKYKSLVIEVGKFITLSNIEDLGKEIQRNFYSAKKINCKGLIIKDTGPGSEYKFGKRSWYKVLNHA